MASWHLVEAGAVHSGGAAFGPVFARLPGGRPLRGSASGFRRASDRLYRWVATTARRSGARSRPPPAGGRIA